MSSTYDSTGLSMAIYADVLAELIALAVEWKWESLSTSEEELLGHLLRQVALQAANANEKIQALYDALSISSNSGVPLDNILELIGMARQSAAKSTATETFTVSKATTVPAGTVVRTASSLYWTTDEDLVFAGPGSDTVGITCTELGPNNAAVGEIDTLVTTVSGVTEVTNAAAAIPGRLRETDAEFKLRHTAAVATSGEQDAASIAEAVGGVEGVSAVLPVEDYDADSVEIFVIGGDDDEIAAAMDPQITIGIGPILEGTTSVEVYNAKLKQNRTMRFTRGSDVDVYISLTIQTTGLFPVDGDLQIKDAIADLFDGNNLGDDVAYLKIPAAVYQVPGVIIQSLFIGTSPSPSETSDVTMSNAQRASVGIVRDDDGNIIESNIVISHG